VTVAPEDVVRRWQDAVAARDIAVLDDLLAPEFTLTTGRPGAEVRTRGEYLAITRDRYVVEEHVFDELDALRYGDVAIVRSRLRQRGSMDGQDRTQAFRMTDVLVLGADGAWRAVLRHATPLAGSA
jgi:ketosteroid isomerase-like protein